MGAHPEQAVRQFLDKHIVDESKAAEEKAQKMPFFEERLADAPAATELEALYQQALRKVLDMASLLH